MVSLWTWQVWLFFLSIFLIYIFFFKSAAALSPGSRWASLTDTERGATLMRNRSPLCPSVQRRLSSTECSLGRVHVRRDDPQLVFLKSWPRQEWRPSVHLHFTERESRWQSHSFHNVRPWKRLLHWIVFPSGRWAVVDSSYTKNKVL